MSISARDKKILILLTPLVVVLGFWFVLLAPKRSEATHLGDQLTAVEQKRDAAVSAAGQLQSARETYAKDYETVVRLGKAVPASLDTPSLLVQLDEAAKGTKIRFDSIKAGERTTAPAPAAATPAPGASSSSSSPSPASAAGGAAAKTGEGQTAEKANNAKTSADKSSAAAGSTSAAGPPAAGGAPGATGSPPSTGATAPSSGAAAPSTGAPATGSAAPATGSAAPGLDSVPLEFAFTGSFFDLADFFHEMKRFVRVANDKIKVKGRLMTVDSLDFKSETFPKITASVKATVYLSPKGEGTTAGATPSGPQATPASAAPAPASSPSGTPPSGTPVANPPAGGAQ